MANLKFIGLLALSLFVFSAFAQSAAQAANEVDTVACTKDATNMIWYCQGYCELQSEESCDYDYDVGYPQATDSGIQQCVCKCGVSKETFTYDNVPCGLDLMRKAEPIGSNYNESFCCLPAFALLGIMGAASLRAKI